MAVLLIWLGCSCLGMAYATFVMPGYPKYHETPTAAIYLAYFGIFVLGPVFVALVTLGLITDLIGLAKERS